MPTYVYECPTHGEFEDVHSMHVHTNRLACPTDNCAEEECPQRVRIDPVVQMVDPYGFGGAHVHTTGLKAELGGGPWEDLRAKDHSDPFASAARRENWRLTQQERPANV